MIRRLSIFAALGLGAMVLGLGGCPAPSGRGNGNGPDGGGQPPPDVISRGMPPTMQPPSVPPAQVSVSSLPGHDQLPVDTSRKQSPRLMQAETYVRSMLHLFGDLSPLAAQAALKAPDSNLFDTWNDYLSSLGLPDYRVELRRNSQTNALMLATFERVGAALCEASAVNELHNGAPLDQRRLFPFDPPDAVDAASFAAEGGPFDLMHRTILAYPVKLAPAARAGRFAQLYLDTKARHEAQGAPSSRLTSAEAGWAAVCQGLIRHPEFHLY
jgi:hypothetical protein